jgi:aromatic ring-opening dioxygenase LigB subunit
MSSFSVADEKFEAGWIGVDGMEQVKGMIGGCIVPHPPLLIPAIGGRERETVRATYSAMEELGRRLKELAPEVLVMISPHTPMFRDSFTVKTTPAMVGDFASFGQPQVRISKMNDVELASEMLKASQAESLSLVSTDAASARWHTHGEELDHGLLVPLYYLDRFIETQIVSLSISGLNYSSHHRLGYIARKACEKLGRRAFFVASGDLSHRLIKGAPAGYSPRGAEFDRLIVEIAERGDFRALNDIPDDLIDEAGECGFRSLHTMWGALEDGPLDSSVLSYEGPFGVGYLVSLHLASA